MVRWHRVYMLGNICSYFTEYVSIHNYFASTAIYIGLIIDVITRRQKKWLIPLTIVGTLQGIAFQTGWFGYYMVGFMEFLGLCIGAIFIIKTIKN